MKLRMTRRIWASVAIGLILIVGGKLALDQYFSVPEKEVVLPVPDEFYDPRSTEELESLRFGVLNDDEIQRQCEALMQESGWTHGASLSEILAAGAGGQDAAVAEMFKAFRTSQVEQYAQKTKDPESVRPKTQEILTLWAAIDVDDPNSEVLSRIGALAHEAIAAGSSDPLIEMMALRFQSQPIDEAGHKRLSELPAQLTAAGYRSIFPLMVQMFRLGQTNPDDAMNHRLMVKEVIRATVAYMDEYSHDKALDRLNWFNLFNAARMLNLVEQEQLYQRLLASEKTSPFALHMLAGVYYADKARELRGGGFASKVAEDAWPNIEKLFSKSSLHFRKAWILRPDLPHAAWAMTDVANASPGHEAWSPRNWFELTCRAQFDFMPAYSAMLNSLLPRWGGSHEEMMVFGQECAATKAFDTFVPYKLIDCVLQIGKETTGGKSWENPEYVKPLTDFWAALDHWGTEHTIDRKGTLWTTQVSIHAAMLVRNRRYAEAKTVLDKIDGPPIVESMLNVVRDPQMAASSAYALSEPGAEPLIEIEKRFGTGIPRSATEEELDQALKVVSEARAKNLAPRATLYFTARENSLAQQKKFLSGAWVDLPFDADLNYWRIQDSVATVESPTSLHLSNLTYPDATPLAVPRAAFSPPYEVQVTLERIRGEQFFDRVAVNVGAISQALVLGEPGGMSFILDDVPRVVGTYLPNGVQPQVYYFDGLGDRAMMGLQIWTGHYRLYVDNSLIPVLPISDFRADSQLSFGGNVWEIDTGEIRISDVRIRRMLTQSPPAIDAGLEETIEYLTEVVELEPTNIASRLALADALARNKKDSDAVTQFEAVHKIAPEITRIHGILGVAFLESGREQEALPLLLSSLKFKPSDSISDRVAWVYATAVTDSLRNGEESLKISTEICDRTQNQQWTFLATKAAALAERKRFPEAIELSQKTIELTPPEDQEMIKLMLAEFQKNRPWRGKATE